MSDKLPGSSWSNPIWQGKWRIFVSDSPYAPESFCFCHDDFDGAPDANDTRHGYGTTIQSCREQIAEYEAEK